MRCQTELKGADMTADSVTEVEVGMREAILLFAELSMMMGIGILFGGWIGGELR